MAWIDIRIETDNEEQLEKVKNRLFGILMNDDDVCDFYTQDESQ